MNGQRPDADRSGSRRTAASGAAPAPRSRVHGRLTVHAPGVGPVPVRLEGRGRALAVTVGNVRAAGRLGGSVPLRPIARALGRQGWTLELRAGPFPCVRLGEPDCPIRLKALGALLILLHTPVRRLPELFRRWRETRSWEVDRG